MDFLHKAVGTTSVQLKIIQPPTDGIRMEQKATAANIPETVKITCLTMNGRLHMIPSLGRFQVTVDGSPLGRRSRMALR